MTLRLAYNTNGWPQHRLDDIVTILSEMGYAGVAITPDVFHLDPFDRGTPERAAELRRRLDDLNLAVAVETGARFVLDPRRKHQPTLLGELPEATRRLDLLRRCLDLAVALRAETF
ncbi:MAG TPA: sugar phosphate isomerase/epimerase, partial [Planctomycetota bacterium]|nr:sugar phosphate isomerase/epimerase [Planctomycetota bacterium]